MIIRHCKHCKKVVEVQSKCATVVICEDCRIKAGFCSNKLKTIDTDEFISCRICHKTKRRLDLHLSTEHSLTIEQYLQQFPDALIFAKNTSIKRNNRDATSRKRTSDALKASWANEEVKKKRVKQMRLNPPAKGMHHSLETKLKLAKTTDYRYSMKGKRKDIKYSVRGMNEANICRMLDFCNIKYEYETKYFELSNGKVLIIDFYLYEDFEMIKAGHFEFKGWKKNSYYSNKEKFDLFEKEYPEDYKRMTMFFPTDDNFKILENKYKALIPMWETNKRNLFNHPEIYSVDRINPKQLWNEFIVCPLCLKKESELQSRQQFLSYKHLAKHNYTIEQFKQEFPDVQLKIESLGKQHSEVMSGVNHFNYGKHLTQETRDKISKSLETAAHFCTH